ncbi:MAG TPA: glycosyltransferase family 2 protein [Planctomycetaceae bacterium]|nr:glycosyltransferase family 2 protein [Planctomycetaceae bacterium]
MQLTAILCNYNHAEFLPQAVTAILQSRRPPDELILVDDGSTDNSREIIEAFASRDSRIRVIWHEVNQGWHAGIAHGLAIATGDWIYSGAADDYVLPDFFARAEELSARWPNAGIISGAFRRILPDGRFLRREVLQEHRQPVFLTPERYRKDRRLAWRSFSPSTIYRRAAIDAAGGFRRELGYWADTFVTRVAGERWGMVYFPEDCVCYREMPTGMSGSEGLNFNRVSEIIHTAERLMSSSGYAGLFTPDNVQWWLRQAHAELRNSIAARYAAEMEVAFAPVIEFLLNPPPGASPASGLLHWVCRKGLSAAFRCARWTVVTARTQSTFREVIGRHHGIPLATTDVGTLKAVAEAGPN